MISPLGSISYDGPSASEASPPTPCRSEAEASPRDDLISGGLPSPALPLSESGVESQAIREIMGTQIECEFDEMNIAVTILCMKRLTAETGVFPTAVQLGGNVNSYASWRSAAITHLRNKEKEKFRESTISIS